MIKRARNLKDRLTLRSQSMLLAVAICAGTVGLTAATSAWMARREALELARNELSILATAMAQQLDLGMFERFREVRNVARLTRIASEWRGDTLAVREILEQLRSTLPDYAWIGFADARGTVRAATGGRFEGWSVAQRSWFLEGLSGMTARQVGPASRLAAKLSPSLDGGPPRLVDIASPVLGPDGRLVGVLAAHLSWSWALDLRSRVLEPAGPDAGIELWLLSADGSVLLAPDADAEAEPPTVELPSGPAAGGEVGLLDAAGGKPMLSASAETQGLSPYPGLGWRVVARRDLAAATASADRLFWTILGVGSLAILLGAAGAWRAAAGVTDPVQRLVRSADRIGRDPSVRSLERVGGSRDVVVLSSALRALLRRLEVARATASLAELERQDIEVQASAEQRRLAQELDLVRSLAEHDPLTGLRNRRSFACCAEDAWQGYRRHARPLAVLLVDIDRFKQVNDTLGHAVGDTVLCRLAGIISQTMRTTDEVARYGGEEFVALLPETGRGGALALAERLRRTIALAFQTPEAPARVTVSIGVALARPQDRDLDDVIERADRALYRAKASGRNRVACELADAEAAA